MSGDAVLGAVAALADLPDRATILEAAERLTYADAVQVASSILNDIQAQRLVRPYPLSVRISLRVCAEVFAREAGLRARAIPPSP